MRRLILALLLLALPLLGTDYYVSQVDGNDSYNGLYQTYQSGTDGPWLTVSKVQSTLTGDQSDNGVYFRRGGEWREELICGMYGTTGQPFTIGAYSSGANPIINGADLMETWTSYSGNTWQKTGVTTEPQMIFMDNIRLTKGSDKDSLNDHEWTWESDVLYLRDETGDPDVTGVVIEASQRICVNVGDNQVDYIDIAGLWLTKSNTHGIGSDVSTHINVYDNIITYVAKRGVHINNGSDYWNVYNNLFDYCGVEMATQEHAIYPSFSDHLNIYNNEVSHSWNKGLQMTGCSYVEIYNNYFHDNNEEGGGGNADIQIGSNYEDATDIRIFYNLFKSGPDKAIFVDDFGGGYTTYNLEIYNNTIYGSTDDYLIYVSDTEDAIIENNIFYANGNYVFYYDGNTNLSSDYNCYYNWQHGTYIGYSEGGFVTWATWSATETHSINADPVFVNLSSKDFWLQSTSPCIDAGVDVGLRKDFRGNPVGSAAITITIYPGIPVTIPVYLPDPVDIGAYEYGRR